MSATITKEHFTEAVLYTLDETFENVHGVYLDRGTSLFETLATITAEEASHPMSATCASLAAHVEHIRFYLENTIQFAQGNIPDKIDWNHIWQTVREVTPEEWEASKARLRETYGRIVELVRSHPTWDDTDVIGGVMGMIIHTAYHLGEIRQALCALRGSASPLQRF
jgi:hypothetical protein